MRRAARDDDALVAAFRAGDEAAFEMIDARYRAALIRYARRVLRGTDDDLAEDVVQEALWRAHRALRRDARPMKLRAWLYKLVRNCALDEIGRVRIDSLDVADERPAADPRDEPAAAAERRDDLRRLLGDVAALPATQRHALVRRELDGLSHADIAAELAVTPLAVRMLVHRARAGLAGAAEARGPICAAVRTDLLAAADERRRATARSLRHLAACPACRELRTTLHAQRQALGALAPPGALLAAAAAFKLALAGKATGAKVAAGTAATATVVAGTGLGVQIFDRGDPSPVALQSLALPGGAIARAAPLPRDVAIVQRVAAHGSRSVKLACPPGLRVADLIPPRGGRVNVTYAPDVVVGSDRAARFELEPAAPRRGLTVSMLCRRPDGAGSIVAAPMVRTAHATHRVGAARADLRARIGGRALAGSVRRNQPVRVTAERPGWRRIVTDDGQTGWLPAGALR
jgi:RNA polymerase sigma factor (sigma-70 family)